LNLHRIRPVSLAEGDFDMNTRIWIGTLLISALLAAPATWARGPGRGDGERPGLPRIAQLANQLGLTEDQKSAIREIVQRSRSKVQAQREKILNAQKELAEAIKEPKKGAEVQKKLTQKFSEIQALKTSQATAQFEMALSIRELLDPDQLEKFAKLRGGPGFGMGKGMGKPRGMNHGMERE